MKKSMPRLVDDRRKQNLAWVVAGASALFIGAWIAHDAWTKPFRERREELGALASEVRGVLDRLDREAGADVARRLSAAKARMESVAGKTLPGKRVSHSLEINPDLYVSADREKAGRIRADHAKAAAELAQAEESLARACKAAADCAGRIGKLQVAPVRLDIDRVRTELDQSIGSLDDLLAKPRPEAGETESAKKRFADLLASADAIRTEGKNWHASASDLLAEAAKTAEAAEAAAKRAKSAAAEIARLRTEADRLEIDPKSRQLEVLRENLAFWTKTVRKGEGILASALRKAEAERAEIVKEATAACEKDVARIAALIERDGALLSAANKDESRKAKKAFEGTMETEAADWRAFVENVSSLGARAKRLCDEADRLSNALSAAPKTGLAATEGVRATELVSELKAAAEELDEGVTAGYVSELKRKTVSAAARVEAARRDLDAEKPDIPKLLDELHANANVALDELARAAGKWDQLRILIENGTGSAKAKLESARAQCAISSGTEAGLRALERATAPDGNTAFGLQEKLRDASRKVKSFATAVDGVADAVKRAERDGTFVRLSWEEGALVRDTGHGNGMWSHQSGDILVPRGTSGRYEWTFALDIPNDGTHKIVVLAERAASGAVNDSIPENYSPKREELNNDQLTKMRRKGGWIGIGGRLAVAGQSFANEKNDFVWMLNYKDQFLGGNNVVVSGETPLRKGRQSFSLTIDLVSRPDRSEKRWNPEKIRFRVYLDDKPVSKFWHKKQ